ncbi:MAG: nitrogen fixation protein NifQ [Pseudomonadota bacterium]
MDAHTNPSREPLMAYARRPDDLFTQAFAATVRNAVSQGRPPALQFGLSETQFSCLVERYFPGAGRELFVLAEICDENTPCPAFREDEIQDLAALLLEHRANDRDETHWLAYAIAMGCMGGNHLWQDMGLSGRQALSDLLRQNFTALHDQNTGNMKWKKFFYKQLCNRAEVNMCKAPSCQVCNDYRSCFGPETADAASPVAAVSP